MPAQKQTQKEIDDEIAKALSNISVVEGIALKLWWGWTPLTKQKKWIQPGNWGQSFRPMSTEEKEWFRRH